MDKTQTKPAVGAIGKEFEEDRWFCATTFPRSSQIESNRHGLKMSWVTNVSPWRSAGRQKHMYVLSPKPNECKHVIVKRATSPSPCYEHHHYIFSPRSPLLLYLRRRSSRSDPFRTFATCAGRGPLPSSFPPAATTRSSQTSSTALPTQLSLPPDPASSPRTLTPRPLTGYTPPHSPSPSPAPPPRQRATSSPGSSPLSPTPCPSRRSRTGTRADPPGTRTTPP